MRNITRISIVLVLQILLICLFLNCSNREKSNQIIGVKIYDYNGSFPKLFEDWNSIGINTAFVNASLDSNVEFRELAKKNDIKTFIILPIFNNLEELQKRPDLYAITKEGTKAIDDWVNFVCPTRKDYRKQRIEYIKNLVKQLNPDGISIDFIRHFVFWEKVYPERTLNSLPNTCFDSSCLNEFQRETNIDIPISIKETKDISKWILYNHYSDWVNWKCGVISSMVEEIVSEVKKIKPDLLINIHLVPWRQNDFDGAVKIVAGQDIKALAQFTDYLSPMCYFQMVKQKPAWVSSVVRDMYNQSQGQLLPSIQVKKAYLKEELSVEDFKQALEESLKPPSKGVVFWNWKALAEELEKMAIVKNIVQK